MPAITGSSDADEVKRARAKLLAIRRTERRLRNRLADIDWEYDVLKPELQEFESTITTVGELPEFSVDVQEPKRERRKRLLGK